MDINDRVLFLVVLLVLVGTGVGLERVVYFVWRLRAGERGSFPLRILFRLCLYLASSIISASGLTACRGRGLLAAVSPVPCYRLASVEVTVRSSRGFSFWRIS